MRARCGAACALFDAAGPPPAADAAEVLAAGKAADAWDACALAAAGPLAAAYVGAASAEQNARSTFSEDLRNRTCAADGPTAGPHLGAAPRTTWAPADGHAFGVVPLWRGAAVGLPAANVTLLEGFATADECAHAMAATRPHLRPATVNEEGDAAAKSLSRRAYAAHLVPDLRDPDDVPARIWRRAFDMANGLTGLGLDVEGQEPFSVIHYNGTERGGSALPDEYRPHCDGGCDGAPHLHGGRVATLLLYCEAPTAGGATTFANARVAVKPKALDAVFFSYYDAASGTMDTGHTVHSGCPVLAGEKWVMTLWMRRGVRAGDAWSKYDPTGARHL